MKTRLDVYLTENGLAPSREKAKALIMAGCVFVNNEKEDKAGRDIKEDDVIEVRGNSLRYVSRGGLKLEKAVSSFNLSLDNKVCMDVGASTGGFSDVMLQNGAQKVYAVDVGYGQLAWVIRQNPKVVCLERTNVRYLTEEQVPEKLDFVSIDVSFISLKLVLPVVHHFLKEDGCCVALIKPQFEAGRDKVGKKGVVRDPKTHCEVIEQVLSFTEEMGFIVHGLTFSPIRGPEGNIEYLMYIKKIGDKQEFAIEDLVEQSHKEEGI